MEPRLSHDSGALGELRMDLIWGRPLTGAARTWAARRADAGSDYSEPRGKSKLQ